jgi:hypothetical protein
VAPEIGSTGAMNFGRMDVPSRAPLVRHIVLVLVLERVCW